MGKFVASKTMKLMIQKGMKIVGSHVLVLGFTFKENCPDTRNTKVIDVVRELEAFGVNVDVYDPYAMKEKVKKEYALTLLDQQPNILPYDAIIVAVAHEVFKTIDFKAIHEQGKVVFDTKALVEREWVDGRL
ncbi:UDP-N-acetyl-D-glucosamine 6-dehydrogenase [bioreactor metagenome]|uniref:UDP-N-acetyl-D-glucosamine 6-dehydrogenase n=1 Tax=bioreactor metagenome TaxID=1076179 RepID=A0A645IUI9_9ZZZZ